MREQRGFFPLINTYMRNNRLQEQKPISSSFFKQLLLKVARMEEKKGEKTRKNQRGAFPKTKGDTNWL